MPDMPVVDEDVRQDKVKIAVQLEVSFRVTVLMQATSDKSINELQDVALAAFKKAQGNNMSWRTAFRDYRDIEVGFEQVKLVSVNSQDL